MLKHSYRFGALGTEWSIETTQALTAPLKEAIDARIGLFDATYSRFRDDSIIGRIAKEAGTYSFPDDAMQLFHFYRKLYDLTAGKVTPLIGDVLVRAGYDSSYSLQAGVQLPVPRWNDVMQWHGSNVTVTQPVTIDVGAAGKGYLVDIIASVLDKYQIEEYVVDGSGDLRHKGTSENRVGLEHPLDPKKIIGVVDVRGKSLCASASNRRAWGKGLHHIFDPDSMTPTNKVIATWVVADDAMIADGVATALFFVDPVVLLKEFTFQYVRMYKDGAIDYSPDFEGELF